ncbi:MAG: hypothetical protein KJ950_09435 [Proteobacteria bacterium]|nr:hypothetical protein [Pseudomonadota bacterium]MBU1687622.1 hypothetical protein [Pseudomonadota bacterium]
MDSKEETELVARLAELYARMEAAYDRVAQILNFTCDGCPDNCCDSYFQHHTVVEWWYLQRGLRELPPERQREVRERATAYGKACDAQLEKGQRPVVMCPLNESGRCILYRYRLMICRMHGVPSQITRPDGQSIRFPGCFRCQEIPHPPQPLPEVDRTPLYRELAGLEQEIHAATGRPRSRIKMTIAEMILKDFADF